MNAHIDPSQGDWMMGGSSNPKACAAFGLTEAEVAQMAVEAFDFAWSKLNDCQPGTAVQRSMAAYEIGSQIEVAIRERLDLDLCDGMQEMVRR